MDRKRIKDWLTLSVLNVSLAAIGKGGGDLETAADMLYERVEELVKQAQREALTGKQ